MARDRPPHQAGSRLWLMEAGLRIASCLEKTSAQAQDPPPEQPTWPALRQNGHGKGREAGVGGGRTRANSVRVECGVRETQHERTCLRLQLLANAPRKAGKAGESRLWRTGRRWSGLLQHARRCRERDPQGKALRLASGKKGLSETTGCSNDVGRAPFGCFSLPLLDCRALSVAIGGGR